MIEKNPVIPQTAGDDLVRMADELENLRGFLLGLHGNLIAVTPASINHMAEAESAVRFLFADKWQECQAALAAATDADLAETNTTWMGKGMPWHFVAMTLEQIRGGEFKARQIRQPTNPSTLISQGKLNDL